MAVKENILAVRKKANTKDEGVLIIDPNKILNDFDGVKSIGNRYVKQEDLVMYANLKAIVKPMGGVIVNNGNNPTTGSTNDNTNREPNVVNVGELKFNILNPQEKGKDGQYQFTDIFSETYYNYDNEGYGNMFGIESINISQNASIVPTVKITFVDIQGKVLMERGDDDLNPYNLFYRFPYPQFLLTVKGYYGDAIDYPLYLLKTSTTFDPTSGNYKVECEFLSRTFAIFNSFFNVYALVVPYLVKLDDNKYLGNELLKKLFEKQNNAIKTKYVGQTEYLDALLIDGAPTVMDLYNTLDKLSQSNFVDTPETIALRELISKMDSLKTTLNNTSENVILNVQNNTNNSLILENSVTTLNNTTDEIAGIVGKGNIFKFSISSFNDIDSFSNKITEISKICDGYIDEKTKKLVDIQIVNIKNKIGYEPNIRNILRILLNSMEIFLHLLSEVSSSAIEQITNNSNNRKNNQAKGEFFQDDDRIKRVYPFPNYFIKENTSINPKKAYPGKDARNLNWSEVYFVNEIYNAIDRLEQTISEPIKQYVLDKKESGYLFANQVSDLNSKTRFGDNNPDNMLFEMIYDAYGYFTSKGFSFLDYGSTNDENFNKLVESIIDYQLNLFDSIVVNADGVDKNKVFNLITQIKQIVDKQSTSGTKTGSFIEYIKANLGPRFDSFNNDILNAIKTKTTYKDIDLEFDKILAKYNIPTLYKGLFRYNLIDNNIVVDNIPENGGYFSNDYTLGEFTLDKTNPNSGIRKYLNGSIFDFSFNQDLNTMFYGQKFTPLTFSLSENQEEFLNKYHTENAFSGKTKYTKLVK